MLNLNRLAGAIADVRPGEGTPLLLLFLHAVCKGTSLLFFETASNSLFLTNFGIGSLGYVYVGTAIVSIAMGSVYTRAEHRLSPKRLMCAVLLVLLAVDAGLYVTLLYSGSRAAILATMVWRDVQWVLSELEFWAVAGLVFNVRQGKRLFGVLASADTLGRMLSGIAVSFFVTVWGAVNLLAVVAISIVLSLALLGLIIARYGARFAPTSEEEDRPPRAVSQLIRDPYIRLIFVAVMLILVGAYYLEFAFLGAVRTRYPSQEEIAAFLGLFTATLNGVGLFAGSYLSGRVLVRFGFSASLVAVPVLLGAGLLAAVLVGAVSGVPAIAFWGLALMKLLNTSLNETFLLPTFRLLNQPLPWADRLRVQALRESVVEPAAIGLSGASLVVLSNTVELSPTEAAAMAAAFFVVCALAGRKLFAQYIRVLKQAVEKRRLGDIDGLLGDSATVAVLQARLHSPHPMEVLYSASLLRQLNHPDICPIMAELSGHPEPAVRRLALDAVCDRQCPDGVSLVRSRMMDEDPEIRGAAARILCRLRGPEAVDAVAPCLDDPHPAVRRGALAGLLVHGGPEGFRRAQAVLSGFLASPAAPDRRLAAQVVGDAAHPELSSAFLQLLDDADTEVRRTALAAAASVKEPAVTAAVVRAMSDPGLRQTASNTLVAIGDTAVPLLADLLKDPGTLHHDRLSLIGLLARIGTTDALLSLSVYMTDPDVGIRQRVLAALAQQRFVPSAEIAAKARHVLADEVETWTWACAAVIDLGADAKLVTQAIRSELDQIRGRVLSLVTILGDSSALLQARKRYESGLADQRARALELFDVALSGDVKQLVVPVLDELSPAQSLARLSHRFPQRRLGVLDRLANVLELPDQSISAWTIAAVLHEVGRRRPSGFSTALARKLKHAAPLVRETAAAVLFDLDRTAFTEAAPPLLRDCAPIVVSAVRERLNVCDRLATASALDGPRC